MPNDTHAFNSLAKGMYYPALVPFFQQFPSSQLFIIRTEDISLNPFGFFQRLARFLDIDPTFFAEKNFYQDKHLMEDELMKTPSVKPKVQVTSVDYHSNILSQAVRPPRQHNLHIHHYLNNDEPQLSTRYRLQRVFRHLNNRLSEIFDSDKTYFNEWIYDVDRG